MLVIKLIGAVILWLAIVLAVLSLEAWIIDNWLLNFGPFEQFDFGNWFSIIVATNLVVGGSGYASTRSN